MPAEAKTASPDNPPRVKAAAGVGKRGQGYGGGIITEPIRQRFLMADRIVFTAQIPSAMNMYKAMDPQGKGPTSHEEFMEKIIKKNRIRLPDLPEGERYRFDAEKQELMVERPQ